MYVHNLVPFYKVYHTREFIFIQISFTQKFRISLNIYQASTIQQTLQVQEHAGQKRNTTGEEWIQNPSGHKDCHSEVAFLWNLPLASISTVAPLSYCLELILLSVWQNLKSSRRQISVGLCKGLPHAVVNEVGRPIPNMGGPIPGTGALDWMKRQSPFISWWQWDVSSCFKHRCHDFPAATDQTHEPAAQTNPLFYPLSLLGVLP